MNLLHKLVAIVLFAAYTSGLSADCCCCCSGQNGQPLPFTLTEFIKAEKAAQAVMVSDLLQNGEFSNDEIARVLEVDVKYVARAREFFGPLEVEALVREIENEHERRCRRQFGEDVVDPVLKGSLLVSAVILFGALYWRCIYLMGENMRLNRRLKEKLFEIDPSPKNFELLYPPR